MDKNMTDKTRYRQNNVTHSNILTKKTGSEKPEHFYGREIIEKKTTYLWFKKNNKNKQTLQAKIIRHKIGFSAENKHHV